MQGQLILVYGISLTMFDVTFSTWDEIHDVFGDGHDYDWALIDDEEEALAEEAGKPEMKYQDVS